MSVKKQDKAYIMPSGPIRSRFTRIISSVILAFVVAFAVLMLGTRLMGFKTFTIMSGSMEPSYPVGSLVFIKPTNPKELSEGDVITFMADEETVVTHRVNAVKVEGGGLLRFQTKGDANSDPDGKLVDSRNVIGQPVFSLPVLGYVAFYVSRPPGIYVSVGIGILLLVTAFVPSLFNKGKEKNPTKDQRQYI